MGAAATRRTAFRTCPLCEAGCGLELLLEGDEVVRIRGDRDDVFSAGYLCPKGPALKQLHEDPDRLRTPLVRRDGRLEPATWEEAYAEIERRLLPIIEASGRDAVAAYLGNPNIHSLASLLYLRPMLRALGTTNVFSASTVDQRPKEVATALMFGSLGNLAVPDIDRTDFLLLLGANPWASNGSAATAPDWPGRIERLKERGGTFVVVDPRRTRTAEAATQHLFVRPGTDAVLLMAMAATLFEEGLVALGHLAPFVNGLDALQAVVAPLTPDVAAPVCGIDAEAIRALARDLAAAPSAAVYGRLGTTAQEFGTLASWMIDVLNILTGNLDRPGGVMFPTAAAGALNTSGAPRYGRGTRFGRRHSRVSGKPETFGEYPAACLAEEIETPGEGQVRALVTVAGNPVSSTPNSDRLDRAMASLEFVLSIDFYVNETTRHADVILPGTSPLSRSHYDLATLQAAVRNVANFSPPVVPLAPGEPEDWEVLAKLALLIGGAGADADPAVVDDGMARAMVEAAVADEYSPVHGRDVEELLAMLAPRTGPERLLDFLLRSGPYGDGFGAKEEGLSLDVLLARPHGVDLGPLVPRLPDILRTPTGMIELAPEAIVDDVARLEARTRTTDPGLVLIGRRHVRSNNSWMHNLDVLVRGKRRFSLQVSADDAARLGIADGGMVRITSRAGSVEVEAEVTAGLMPGVVSLPHGWGNGMPGARLGVASSLSSANANVLTDEGLLDEPSGNAVLNGIPVVVEPVT